MQTRTLGRTGLQISELVVGAGAVGGLFVRGTADEQRKALAVAADAGINWVDTAPLYGQGASETALGQALSSSLFQPHLSTKVMIDVRDLADIPGQVERSLVQSLGRLGRDKVTLLQLHNPLADRAAGHALQAGQVLRSGGVLDGLRKVRDAGLCDFIGLTALGDAAAIIETIDSGGFDTAQVYFNLLNPTAVRAVPAGYPGARFDGVLDACARQRMGTLAIRIFSAGVIATDARHGREAPLTRGDTVDSETGKAAAMTAALGTSYGTRAQAAVRFVLRERGLHAAVVGFERLAYLEEAIAAQAMGPLPDDAMSIVEAVWASAR